MDNLEMLLRDKNIFIPKGFNKYKVYLIELKDRHFDMFDNLGIIYVLSGNVKIEEIDRDISLEKNDLYIINKDTPHIIEGTRKKNIALLIEIKDEYLKEYLDKDNYYFSNEMNTLEKKMLIGIMGKLFLDSTEDNLSYDERDVILEKMLSMLNLTNHESPKLEDDNIKNMVYEIGEYIFKDYLTISQKSLTLEDIAKEHNISYHYLSRSFKKYLGENYTDFLLRIRLENALDLILNTDNKIIHISEVSGFNSVKAFNVAFKKSFNLSPTEFKEKFEKDKKVFYREDLYFHESTQKFIDDIKYLKHFNILKDDDLYYKIDRRKSKDIQLKESDMIVDINGLFDVLKNLHLLEDVIKDLPIDKLLINISISDDNIYILDRSKEERLLTDIDINNMINIVNEYDIDLIVMINESGSTLDTDFIKNLSKFTNLITGTLGLKALKRFIFGIRIENIVYHIHNNFDDLSNLINVFQDTLRSKYEHLKYRWALSINNISNIDDLELLNRFFKKLTYPELLIMEIVYNHDPSKVELSIDYNLNIINSLNSIAKKVSKDMRIVMDFSYCLDDLDLIDSKKITYTDFYFLSLLLSSKIYHVDIISTDSFYGNYRVNKDDMLLYNSIGIRRNKYYITEYLRSLKNMLIFEDKGIMASEDNEEISIMLYDDYLEFYHKYKGYNITLNEHNNNHYTFEIFGLEGKYKIIEYNVMSKLDERSNNLEYSEYEHCISYSEREYLEHNITPKIKINFKDVHNKLTYKTMKGFGDVVLIKILPI